jgi:signal transduction histidine kinase
MDEGRPRRQRWPLVYYLLAAFNILTVSGSLFLNDQVMDMYLQAVASQEEWTQLMADYTALEELVGEVNATGNDVFETGDAARERRRLSAALAAALERIAALRKDLVVTAAPAQVPGLLVGLEDIERSTRAMAAEAEAVLARFEAKDREAAARQMAQMDRSYAALLAQVREVRSRFGLARAPRPVRVPDPEGLRSTRFERFERQTSAAASLQRWEYLIAGLIVIMVAGAVLYGRAIARRMDRDSAERARHLAELREARESLEQRVTERTEALLRSQADLGQAAADWQQTFEAIEAPVLLLDEGSRVLRANRGAEAALGRPVGEIAGRQVGELSGEEPWATAARLMERGESSAQARDPQRRRTWDVSTSRLGDSGRLIVVARDVSRLVELQEAVGRDERMAAVGGLVVGVAHEVRNPLFGISATLDAFEARAGGEAWERYFTVLRRDVGRLKALMQDLLEYGRPPLLDLRPGPLAPVITEAARVCEPLAKELQLEIDVPEGLPLAVIDRSRLVQVVQNVIQNALQHSPDGSTVRVAARAEDQHAVIEVKDAGPGFPPEDLKHLFEPFFTRRQGGTGLGLSIAQRIVEQHGGQIQASNHPAGGALVTVRLPLARRAA